MRSSRFGTVGNLRRMGIATGIVVAVVLLVLLVMIYRACARNTFTRQAESLATSWAEVDAELRRRRELGENLHAVVVRAGVAPGTAALAQLGFAARQAAGHRDESPMARSQAEQTLTGALSHVLHGAASRPLLAADATYQRLCGDLVSCEERLAIACCAYNGKVAAYNARFDRLPSRLLRGAHRKAQRFEFVVPASRAPVAYRGPQQPPARDPRGAERPLQAIR